MFLSLHICVFYDIHAFTVKPHYNKFFIIMKIGDE